MFEALLVLLLSILGSLDPNGWAWASYYPIIEVENLERGAQANMVKHQIEFDDNFFYNIYNEEERNVWGACVLVHEAVHLRYNTYEEDIPLARQYVCLDRLGAPESMKDWVYSRLGFPTPRGDHQ